MENKKKRGPNYTMAEKATLLKLVNIYKSILESKETHALMISKKRETWNVVAKQYNAVSSSGIRTWHQLRNLYENIKQRSKKKVAKESEIPFIAEELMELEQKCIPVKEISQESVKDQYFKIKLKNAKLENRYLISKHKMELKKYKLELEILKCSLHKLRYQRVRH